MSAKVAEENGKKVLKIDNRTIDKKKNPPNIKHLKFARNLPIECDSCPYRSIDDGGNGICPKYEPGAACIVRKDIAKMVDEYDGERDPNILLGRMEATFENESEKLIFYEQMEDLKGELNPEVTKRMNSIGNLGKIIAEIKTKERSVEITTKALPRNMHEKIGEIVAEKINITQKEVVEDES